MDKYTVFSPKAGGMIAVTSSDFDGNQQAVIRFGPGGHWSNQSWSDGSGHWGNQRWSNGGGRTWSNQRWSDGSGKTWSNQRWSDGSGKWSNQRWSQGGT